MNNPTVNSCVPSQVAQSNLIPPVLQQNMSAPVPIVVQVPPQQHLVAYQPQPENQPANSFVQSRMVVPLLAPPYHQTSMQGYIPSYPAPTQLNSGVVHPPVPEHSPVNNHCQQPPPCLPGEAHQALQPQSNRPKPEFIPVTRYTGDSYYIEYYPAQNPPPPIGVPPSHQEYSLVDGTICPPSIEKPQPSNPPFLGAQTYVYAPELHANASYIQPLTVSPPQSIPMMQSYTGQQVSEQSSATRNINYQTVTGNQNSTAQVPTYTHHIPSQDGLRPISNAVATPPQAIQMVQCFTGQQALEQPPETLGVNYQASMGHQKNTALVPSYTSQIPPQNFPLPGSLSYVTTTNTCSSNIPAQLPQTMPPSKPVNQMEVLADPKNVHTFNPPPPRDLLPSGSSTVTITQTTTTNTYSYSSAKIPVQLPQTMPHTSKPGNQQKLPAPSMNPASVSQPPLFTPPQLEPILRPQRDAFHKSGKKPRNASTQQTRPPSRAFEHRPKSDSVQPGTRLSSLAEPMTLDKSPHTNGIKTGKSKTSLNQGNTPSRASEASNNLPISESLGNTQKNDHKNACHKNQQVQDHCGALSKIESPSLKEATAQPPLMSTHQSTGSDMQLPVSPEAQTTEIDQHSEASPLSKAVEPKAIARETELSPRYEPEGADSGTDITALKSDDGRKPTSMAVAMTTEFVQSTDGTRSKVKETNHTNPEVSSTDAIQERGWLPSIQLLSRSDGSPAKGKMDEDMAVIYVKNIPASSISGLSRQRTAEEKLKQNVALLGNKSIPGAELRQQMLRSLSRDFGDTASFKQAARGFNHQTSTMKGKRGQHMQVFNFLQSPMQYLHMCLSPVLPLCNPYELTLHAPPLSPYAIPFSSSNSLFNEALQNKELKAHLKELAGSSFSRLCSSEQQMGTINSVTGMMEKTFPGKVRDALSAKESDPPHSLWHSKFLAHMALTSLLYFRNDPSQEGKAKLTSVISHLLTHLEVAEANRESLIEEHLELLRALNTLISDDTFVQMVMPLIDSEPQAAVTLSSVSSKRGATATLPDEERTPSISRLQKQLILALDFTHESENSTYYLATLRATIKAGIFSTQSQPQEPALLERYLHHLAQFTQWLIDSLKENRQDCTADNISRGLIDSLEKDWLHHLQKNVRGLQMPSLPITGQVKKEKDSQAGKALEVKSAQQGLSDESAASLQTVSNLISQIEKEIKEYKKQDQVLSITLNCEIAKLVRSIGEIEKKKRPKTPQQQARKTKGPSKPKSKVQKASDQNPASPNEPISQPQSLLVKGVAGIYKQLDFLKPPHEIIQQVQSTLGEQLTHPAHAFWVFTDLAFQGFQPQAYFVATASTAMEAVKKLHENLSTAITNPPEPIDSKSQATDFIRTKFPHNEIALKNLALLSSRTKLSEVEKARAYTNCSLVLFQEGIQAAYRLLEALEQGAEITGELTLEELITHTEMSRDAMAPLQQFQKALEQPILSCELPSLRKELFKCLRLYGSGSFPSHRSPVQNPERDAHLETLKLFEQQKADYEASNIKQAEAAGQARVNPRDLEEGFTRLFDRLTAEHATQTGRDNI